MEVLKGSIIKCKVKCRIPGHIYFSLIGRTVCLYKLSCSLPCFPCSLPGSRKPVENIEILNSMNKSSLNHRMKFLVVFGLVLFVEMVNSIHNSVVIKCIIM